MDDPKEETKIRGARVLVSTLQTLELCYEKFSPAAFDLIVTDECHRSIYNKFSDILAFFEAVQIGLTATPAQFIDRNTFKFFETDGAAPTFLYKYDDAVKEGYLADYNVYAAQTRFQRQGIKGIELSEEDQQALKERGIDPENIDYEGTDLEKNVTNKDTLRRQWAELMEMSYKDAGGQLPAKTIVFAITQKHALRLEEAFNEMYPEYKGLLARVITSQTERAKDLLKYFETESLPRIAISMCVRIEKMKRLMLVFLHVWLCLHTIQAQEVINLYPGAIPNSTQVDIKENNTNPYPGLIRRSIIPTLEIYLPEKENSTGAAVVICPGGSYTVIVYQGEGLTTAKEFARNGVAAFVLKYRLPNDSFETDKKMAPLQDAQQAIKVVRENAAKWGIDVNKVGIVGFSAGGHLASTEATHFKKSLIENNNNTNLRPDFQILIYPVITMQDSLTHADSRTKLLGKNPSKEIIDEFSNELQVDAGTPPGYITHAADDNVVDVDNSIGYFEKLRKNKVEVEMHIYPKGGHGFIFRQPGWMEPLLQWMKRNNWIK